MLTTLVYRQRLLKAGILSVKSHGAYSSQSLKSPNILLFCYKQSASSINSAKKKLSYCLTKNMYDLKHIGDIQEFFEDPWQESVQALIVWCNDLHLEHDEIVDRIGFKMISFLQNGGKLIVFDELLISKYFNQYLNIESDLIHDHVITFSEGQSKMTLMTKKNIFKKTFYEHKRSLFKVEKNNKSYFLGSAQQFNCSQFSLCLLPLLDKDVQSSTSNANKALKILLQNVQLSCSNIRVERFSSANSNVGVLHLMPHNENKHFCYFLSCCGNKGIQLMTTKEESFKGFLDASAPISSHQYVVVKPDSISFQYDKFDWNIFAYNLSSTKFGRTAIHFDVVETTMNILNRLEVSLPEDLPVLVIANQQSRGKGRGENVWLSPRGCAMFTITIKIGSDTNLGSKPPLIQHLMTVAVVHAIRSLPSYEDFDIGVKWPNDIYYKKETKLGGVLVQSSFARGQFIFKIGCGINVENDKPLVSINTLLKDHYKHRSVLSCEQVIARTVSVLEKLINDFQTYGPNSFLDFYYKYWIHQDADVKYRDENDIEVDGKISGIDENGFLLVQVGKRTVTLHPDGNSFDIMKNLILQKK